MDVQEPRATPRAFPRKAGTHLGPNWARSNMPVCRALGLAFGARAGVHVQVGCAAAATLSTLQRVPGLIPPCHERLGYNLRPRFRHCPATLTPPHPQNPSLHGTTPLSYAGAPLPAASPCSPAGSAAVPGFWGLCCSR